MDQVECSKVFRILNSPLSIQAYLYLEVRRVICSSTLVHNNIWGARDTPTVLNQHFHQKIILSHQKTTTVKHLNQPR